MESSLSCKHCQERSSVTPSTQEVRCHGCRRVIPVGNSTEAVHFRGTTGWSLELEKKKTEAKSICHSIKKKFSCSNTQQSQNESPPRSIITPEPPPRGKRALLCAVAYKKQKFELKGTIQDMKNMKDLLLEQFFFPVESILILAARGGFHRLQPSVDTDINTRRCHIFFYTGHMPFKFTEEWNLFAEEEPYMPPTRKNIEDALQWLVRGITSGDSLVFYFSGHGLRQRDLQSDEIDGFDETICPVDFQTNGMILDNYINKTIVGPLIQGVTLHAIVDSCHSGTVLDLPHVYNINTGKWDDNSPPSGAYKGTSGGIAVSFSACEDYQLAADTPAFSQDKEVTGAMTCTFIRAIKAAEANKQKRTYQGILDSMHQALKQAHKSGCLSAGIRRVFHRRILQDPLLSSSEEFSTSKEFKL